MATPEQIKENKRKLAYLRSLGYKTVPQDGSWGPWLENLWRKATTREKEYPTTPAGLVQRGLDELTGNTTYRVEHPEGEIREASPKSNMNRAATAVVLPAGKATLPLTLAAALFLGNGLEMMRSLTDTGESIKSSIYDFADRVRSKFDSIEDGDDEASTPASSNSTSTTNPSNPPENDKDDKKDNKKESKFKAEAKKVLGNIGKGYGMAAKGAAYGVGYGIPTGLIGWYIYNKVKDDPTPMDLTINAQSKLIEELYKYKQVVRNQQRIDSLLENLRLMDSSGQASNSYNLPEGFVPIAGYSSDDPNKVVIHSSSGDPDSVVILQPDPDISRFKK